ncbi:MAG: AraC family transcriptional regulator [Arcobacter sp.]|nr:MAG: AraC family transcriptional regulator [Arcobacter sp.]
MKKETKQYRQKIVNNTYYYIYKNIAQDISLEELAKLSSLSKYHFHRIFKEESKNTIFFELRSIRLQKAANLLITNNYSSILEIANECGYSSHSSFIKAFKKMFFYSPKEWRKEKYKEYSASLLKKFQNNKNFDALEVKIKVTPSILCTYLRHKGYNNNISKTWEKLNAIVYENNITKQRQIAIYHDNPTIIPLKDCSYVACIEISPNENTLLSTFIIEEGLCAVFSFKGVYGDILNFIRYVYHFWLPNSGYEAKTNPAYSIFKKNHFTSEEKEFDLEFYLPVKVIY